MEKVKVDIQSIKDWKLVTLGSTPQRGHYYDFKLVYGLESNDIEDEYFERYQVKVSNTNLLIIIKSTHCNVRKENNQISFSYDILNRLGFKLYFVELEREVGEYLHCKSIYDEDYYDEDYYDED